MKKLISMKDFVLEIERKSYNQTEKYRIIEWEKKCEGFEKIRNYANFLNQELNIGMFVPAVFDNGKWEVLEEPTNLQRMQAGWADNPIDENFYRVRDYDKAKENVLFEGFEVDIMICGHKYAVNKDLQIVHEVEIGLYFNEIYPTQKPKEIFPKKIEDLVKYNLELTENAIKQLGL